jgi:hypothetical protein
MSRGCADNRPIKAPNISNQKGELAMNRTPHEGKGDSVVSRIFLFGNLQRTIVALALMVSIPGAAIAQYGSGGAGTTPTYTGGAHPSYGSKGAVIGGVVAGAAVGTALLYWKLHNRAKLRGCVVGDGDKLVNEKDNQSYSLRNTQNKSLKSGERVELLGTKVKDMSGEATFEIRKMSKNLGHCTATTAEER